MSPIIPAALTILLAQATLPASDPNAFYDRAGRRDPFQRYTLPPITSKCVGRAECQHVADIQLQGTIRTARGYIGMFSAAGHTFLLRPGQAVLDGEVVSIGENDATFRENISEPTAVTPFKIVTKSLRLANK